MAGELSKLLAKGQVRCSDEEREQAVLTLRRHYAAGRLTPDELEERVEAAYRATTRGDLQSLLADLPSDRSGRMARRVYDANREAWRAHATSYAAVNSGLVVIWATTGAGEFWPVWPIASWGVALAWHGLTWRALARRLRRRDTGDGRPPRAITR